jgi:uridine kinase
MIGDSIIPQPFHTAAARDVFAVLETCTPPRATIGISGESGAGKSEIAFELSRLFEDAGRKPFIFQQDDYFRLPPETNDSTRRRDISWVGLGEVDLIRMNADVGHFKNSADDPLSKPLVIFAEDRISEEIVDLSPFDLAIVEGTYVATLDNLDFRIFLDRSFEETIHHRRERARDKIDEFSERVLEIEHDIISTHKALADVLVNNDYSVTVVNENLKEGKR